MAGPRSVPGEVHLVLKCEVSVRAAEDKLRRNGSTILHATYRSIPTNLLESGVLCNYAAELVPSSLLEDAVAGHFEPGISTNSRPQSVQPLIFNRLLETTFYLSAAVGRRM